MAATFSSDPCFGKSKRGHCTVLIGRECVGYASCPFYKSAHQAKADREKANEALRRKPIEVQTHIAEKYYNGRMLWNGECV